MSKHEIGTEVSTLSGDYKVFKCLTPLATNTDTDINLYECVSEDGVHDVIASDNASCWALGCEDDAEHNKAQFDAVRRVNGDVDWDLIEDDDLRGWIKDRDREARGYETLLSHWTNCGNWPHNPALVWNDATDIRIISELTDDGSYRYKIPNIKNDGACGWDFETLMSPKEIAECTRYLIENCSNDDCANECFDPSIRDAE